MLSMTIVVSPTEVEAAIVNAAKEGFYFNGRHNTPDSERFTYSVEIDESCGATVVITPTGKE